MSWIVRGTLLIAVLAFGGCKGTPDYLDDLSPGRSIDAAGFLSRETFDAGQLVHEAFAGLLEAEGFTSRDLARGVASAGSILARNEVPLLRANALAFLGDVALRFPLPPSATPLRKVTGDELLLTVAAIRDADSRFDPGLYVAQAFSPDRALALRALELLRAATQTDQGTDPDAWRVWWEKRRPEVEAEVDALVAPALEDLASMAIPGTRPQERLINATLVLRLIAYGSLYRPALREVRLRAVANLSHQITIAAVLTALGRTAPDTQVDDTFRDFQFQWSELDLVTAAEVAAKLRDVSFEPALQRAARATLEGQLGAAAATRVLQALAFYPSQTAIERFLQGLLTSNQAVSRAALEGLVAQTGVDFGEDTRAWLDWWTRTGRARFGAAVQR